MNNILLAMAHTRNHMYDASTDNRIRGSCRHAIVFGTGILLAWIVAAVLADTGQQTFATPQLAAVALATAMRSENAQKELLRIFGSQGEKLVSSGDAIADKRARDRFTNAFNKANTIVMESPDKAVLTIGNRAWPFPIPVVRDGEAWRFDTDAGADEILDRRIGRNELGAIEVCRAHVDAQREYAAKDRNGDGVLEYASRFRSSPGQHDGLYWPAGPGEDESPMGPLMASAQAEGYFTQQLPGHKREPYHGYFYRILTRQGNDAPGGASDYIVRGHMIGGFALLAFPAKYGVSGIMTFVVNQDGVVYQKDLGADTETTARRMTEFNPDKSWKPIPNSTRPPEPTGR